MTQMRIGDEECPSEVQLRQRSGGASLSEDVRTQSMPTTRFDERWILLNVVRDQHSTWIKAGDDKVEFMTHRLVRMIAVVEKHLYAIDPFKEAR